MEPTPKQQVTEHLKNANKILIVTKRELNPDGLGSALAMGLVLEKMGKSPTVLASDPIPQKYNYLPLSKIKQKLEGSRDFIITVDQKQAKAGQLIYNQVEGNLEIVITPTNGEFRSEDVSTRYGKFQYDLIVVVGCGSLNQIDRIYEREQDLFFDAALINIDNRENNENYGSVNLINPAATSVAEILAAQFEALGAGLLDADIATCLLAGIMYGTDSFRNSRTTPKSLTVAAQLMAAGARNSQIAGRNGETQPKVVDPQPEARPAPVRPEPKPQGEVKKEEPREKQPETGGPEPKSSDSQQARVPADTSVNLLNLWGIIVANQQMPATNFIYSKVDFNSYNLNNVPLDKFGELTDRLLNVSDEIELAMLFIEHEPNQVIAVVRAVNASDAAKISEIFGGHYEDKAAIIELGGELESQISVVLGELFNEPDESEFNEQPGPIEAASEVERK